jgi:hypothetical protein
MKRLARSTVLWVIAYVATMSVGVWLLWSARASALAQLDDPQQRAQWQEWKQREESRVQEKTSPVERRPPTSEEPPSLVLLRDHFVAVVATCLATGTALFAFLAFVVHGIIAGWSSPPPSEPAEETDQDTLLFARRAGE